MLDPSPPGGFRVNLVVVSGVVVRYPYLGLLGGLPICERMPWFFVFLSITGCTR